MSCRIRAKCVVVNVMVAAISLLQGMGEAHARSLHTCQDNFAKSGVAHCYVESEAMANEFTDSAATAYRCTSAGEQWAYFRISAKAGALSNDGEYSLEAYWNGEEKEDIVTTTRVRESSRKPGHLLYFYTLTDEGREAFIERGINAEGITIAAPLSEKSDEPTWLAFSLHNMHRAVMETWEACEDRAEPKKAKKNETRQDR